MIAESRSRVQRSDSTAGKRRQGGKNRRFRPCQLSVQGVAGAVALGPAGAALDGAPDSPEALKSAGRRKGRRDPPRISEGAPEMAPASRCAAGAPTVFY